MPERQRTADGSDSAILDSLCELAALINPIKDDDWNLQMKKDAEPGGKLDRIMEVATKEYQEGKSLPFPKRAE